MSDNVVNEILNQYNKSSESNYSNNSSGGGVDFTNYFAPHLSKNEKEGTEQIRLLPDPEGGSPFKEVYFHTFQMEDGTWRKFVCPKKNWKEQCPFCEAADLVRSDADNKEEKKQAKKYDPKLYYVVKVVDRKDEDKVKFWRFSRDARGEGTFDKIVGIIRTKGVDVTDPEQGRDLTLNLSRNKQGFVVVSSIVDLDPSPLHSDEAKKQQFLNENSEKTWDDIYKTKPYDYLEIVVKGGTPSYDKEKGTFFDKNQAEGVTAEKHSSEDDSTTIGGEGASEGAPAGSEESGDDDDDDLPF